MASSDASVGSVVALWRYPVKSAGRWEARRFRPNLVIAPAGDTAGFATRSLA